MTISEKQDQLLEELDLFQDWTERYEYVIGLGKKLAPMPADLQTDEKLIKGCQSQVWLHAIKQGNNIHFQADSDSLITKGMIAIFIRILDGETPDNILTTNMDFIEKTGLKEHLAPTRANALNLMAGQIKKQTLELTTT